MIRIDSGESRKTASPKLNVRLGLLRLANRNALWPVLAVPEVPGFRQIRRLGTRSDAIRTSQSPRVITNAEHLYGLWIVFGFFMDHVKLLNTFEGLGIWQRCLDLDQVQILLLYQAF